MPAIPPMLATIGISIARATTFSMVASKIPIAAAAIMAVKRLAPNQRDLLLVLWIIGAKISSSLFKPAILRTESSASSLMTSTTSSTVILPSNIPSLSTTAADTKSAFSNILATSC